jgi:DNA-binding CsgD family transcriptional regulator
LSCAIVNGSKPSQASGIAIVKLPKLYIGLAEKTVKNHVTRILDRLNLRDRTQAAIIASSLLGVDN